MVAMAARGESWPALRVEDWHPTRDTLHMWAQRELSKDHQ
jgi:hypothetical protein